MAVVLLLTSRRAGMIFLALVFDNLPRRRATRPLIGILAALLATAGRLALDPFLGVQMPWPLHFAAVTAAAWFGGLGAGLTAVLTSAVLVEYLVIPPRFAFAVVKDIPGITVFVGVALLLVWQVGRWRNSDQALRQNELKLRDVSDRLQRQLLELEAIYESAAVGLCVLDAQFRWVRINSRLAEMNGFPIEAHIGKTPSELLGEVGAKVEAAFREIMRTGKALPEFEISGTTRAHPGETRVWIERWAPVIDDTGHVIGIAVATEDVTERRRAEEAVRLSEERYRSLVEAAPDAVLINRDGRIAYVNPTALTLFGVSSPEQLMGRSITDVYDPSDRDLVRRRAAAVRAGESVPVVEEKIVRLDGGVRYVEAATAPCRYGDEMGVQVVLRDITDRKLAEAEIASIYDSAPIGLCIFDREGRYLRVNRRMAEINGVAPEAHIGRTFHEVVPGIAEQVDPLLRHVVETGQPIRDVEIRGEVPSAPGILRTWVEHWYPVKDASGTVVGINVAAEEITAMKRVEEELRDANRAKDTFLATLSHELRTPMTAIVGWAHMLERGITDATMRTRAVESISRNAQAQSQLISDVLDMSRALTGKLRLDVQEVDIVSVLGEAIESIRPAIDAKRIELDLSATVGAGTVWADPARLQQIFWNLLSNAVKFTPAGGRITVAITRGASTVDVSIADTGIGIRPEFLPHVFDRFTQADSSTSRQHGGLGLGLSIVRQLVELHGGRVFAASEGEGQGAIFTVSLPFRAAVDGAKRAAEANRAADARVTSPGLSGVRALVLDDVEDARQFVSAVLADAGAQVSEAASAEYALALVAAGRPDVVIADVGMPGIDGYEFIRRMRALPAARGGMTAAIALTAYGSATDRAKALAAGFNEHLPKPVAPDVLLAAVASVIPSVLQRSR